MKIYINGNFFDEDEAKISVFDHGLLLGNSVFETLRTYNGKAFKVIDHVKRLFDSADIIGMRVTNTKNEVINAVYDTLEKNRGEASEFRIRVTMTRGSGPMKLTLFARCNLIISVEELKPLNPDFFEKGIYVVSYKMERYLPSAKSGNMLQNINAKQFADSKGANEALLVDKMGLVREGTISNYFILDGETLITPKNNILKGITREVVISLVPKGIKFEERDLTLEEIYKSREVFITNTTSEILPVVKLNGIIIGNGKPGRITIMIKELFDKYARKQVNED
jgi:branched-chain amino acid aminotransferase